MEYNKLKIFFLFALLILAAWYIYEHKDDNRYVVEALGEVPLYFIVDQKSDEVVFVRIIEGEIVLDKKSIQNKKDPRN